MMKKTVVIILMLLGILTGTPSANELTILEPTRYVRISGAPNVFTDSFSAYPGAGTLIIKNGNQIDENRIVDAISSAEILLNDEQIFGPNDFNQNVYLLEAQVDLVGTGMPLTY